MGEVCYMNDLLEKNSKQTQDLKPAAAAQRSWRCHSTSAAVFLGLLCLLLLTGVIGLAVSKQNATNEMMKTDQLIPRRNPFCRSKDKQWAERDQLRAERDQLRAERDQLRAGRDKIRVERDPLWAEREMLGTERETLKTERDELRAERNKLSTEWNQLRVERDQLRMERDNLWTEIVQLRAERDQLRGERHQLKTEGHDHMRQICECSGCKRFGTSCYIVSNETKTWHDSRADCRSKGGDLAIISNREEEIFLFNLATKHLWFGMTDIVEEGIWVWVDGTPVTTMYWEPVEPNNGAGKVGEEDCAFISRVWIPNNNNPLQGWFDYGCNKQINYICEIAMQL